MIGKVFLLILGIAAIWLGGKGFTNQGLPVSYSKSITGLAAKLLGTACIALGLGIIALVLFWI